MRYLFRPEPAAFALSKFAAHASYNLTSFRDSANGRFRYSYFAPAPCSPPLGGSDGYSAVRFTPAVKYGGRENWPSRRDTRCMSGHPSRAHHKLEWARKEQSIVMLLYEHLSRTESDKDSTQFAHGLSKGARQPYQPSTVKLPASNGRHKRTQSPAVTAPWHAVPGVTKG